MPPLHRNPCNINIWLQFVFVRQMGETRQVSDENRIRIRYNTDFGCIETTVSTESAAEAFSKLENIAARIMAAKKLREARVFWRSLENGTLQLDERVEKRPARIALVLAKAYSTRVTRETLGQAIGAAPQELSRNLTRKELKDYFDENESGVLLSDRGVDWALSIIESLKRDLKEPAIQEDQKQEEE
jgi:hypothetical protein